MESTNDWRSGYHSIDFVGEDGARDEDVAFLVVTDGVKRGDVLVKLATSTYQAYNTWGGHSLYDEDSRIRDPQARRDSRRPRGAMVSFDRPTRSEFWDWEYHLVLWLERVASEEGFSVSYATNFDLASDATYSSDYELLIVGGHDEYWTIEEFDRMRDRIFVRGRNTLFLGANLAYWQVRFADTGSVGAGRGRQLVCYKSTKTDPIPVQAGEERELAVTARFRDLARLPENMLMGVAYQSNFAWTGQEEPRFAYLVEDASLPFLEGTGYRTGDAVAEVIGHEWDNRDPESEFAPPGEERIECVERLWSSGRSRIELLPLEQLRVVLAGEVEDLFGRKGRAEAVYFESPAGARVFSAGTVRWSWGLSKPGYQTDGFMKLNRNLVLHFLRGEPTSGRPS